MRRFQQTRHALGSTAYLTIVLEDNDSPAEIFGVLWRQINAFEKQFSRFLVDSELSKFNAAAGNQQPISSAFRALLMTAKNNAESSGGLYNPCILPALQRAGYKGSWPQPHKAADKLVYEKRVVAKWQDIQIGDIWAMIPANTALDFGGIGKGYLLDKLAETLHTRQVINYWLSLGGDILCSGHDVTGDSWRIRIQNARTENTFVASVKNDEDRLATATSGITKRQGISETGPWHHIIDPRTGAPARTDILTATVCTNNATIADVAAKCLIIAGSDSAESVLSMLRVTSALLQKSDGTTIKLGTIWLA